ncbi:MAG: DUF488 family protein [Planctomycetaceae bacterium]|nr:DUF488 family protein [Planctomycetaceae bacterium]
MIWTTGYARWKKPDAFTTEVLRLGARVADIRMRPWSRDPRWRAAGLISRLGRDHYVGVPALGNVNYKSGGPIAIKDLDAGLAIVLDQERRGPVVLLCGCAEPASCHRTVVAEALRKRGSDVEELPV